MAKNSDGALRRWASVQEMIRALVTARPCAHCGIHLDPAHPGDAYCSQRCLDASRAAHAATVPTTDDDPDAEFPW